MMELTMRGVDKVTVYIDDLLVHTNTQDEQRKVLQLVFNQLHNVCLKLNPEKCEFGAINVSYKRVSANSQRYSLQSWQSQTRQGDATSSHHHTNLTIFGTL